MLIGYLEDDPTQSDLVRQWLQNEGHEVLHRDTGADFIEVLKHHPVDLFILDWQLPDTQGIDVLGKIRQQMGLKAPVIFATQRDSEQDIVSALKGGADDYLKKPLSKAELLARIDSLARRAGIDQSASVVEVGDIVIDLDVESISQKGEPVKLTPKDYKLAVCLLRNVGKILSREYLLREVWGIDAQLNTRTVDVHVSRIRRSLDLVPENGYLIKTIYQHGYRLEQIKSVVDA